MPTEEEIAAAAAAAEAQAAADAEAARIAAEKVKNEAKKPPWGDDKDFGPAKAWDLIQNLRDENKTVKSAADKVAKDAAEKVKNELTQQFAKALGLAPEEADPKKLQEDLAKSQADAKSAAVELAVFRAADGAGAIPSALLDSRSFLASIADIDPTDAKAIAEKIEAAVKDNPLLAKTDPSKPAPKPFGGQGGSGNGGISITEQIAAAQKAGDVKGALRLRIAAGLANQSQ